MTRKTAQDFHPESLKIFSRSVHGEISRREFLTAAPRHALLRGQP